MLGSPGKKTAPLGVFPIAIALIIAAFMGAALGLVWQSSSFDDEEDEEAIITAEIPDA